MYEKLSIKRGFTPDEVKEYDQVLGVCLHIETNNNKEYQERLFNLIKSIIDNHNLDYISKLEKLNILLTSNKSLSLYRDSVLTARINGR